MVCEAFACHSCSVTCCKGITQLGTPSPSLACGAPVAKQGFGDSGVGIFAKLGLGDPGLGDPGLGDPGLGDPGLGVPMILICHSPLP